MGLTIWPGAVRCALLCGLVYDVFGATLVAQQAAEWSLVSTRMAADLTADDGSAVIRMDYFLEGGRPGASIPVQMLGFDAATTDEMNVDGRGPIVLWPASGSLRVATVLAPATATSEGFSLSLEYRIERAVEADDGALSARLPVVVVRLPASEDGVDDRFQASILLPPSWTVTESFPSGLRPGDGAEQEVSLAVVPSVLRFRGRTDGKWRPGFPFLVDLFTGAFLFGFGVLGWRHLRSLAA